MSTRAVIRQGTWTLQPDREPDAEPTAYAMECAVCGESSDVSEGFADGHSWVVKHCATNPSHHTFRERITRPWRTWQHV
ncbi:hypothetical protein [Streptomyces sp. NPDC004629]|uniref:DUF7848 domain-containing protein n=1 Tax=Streptomyces sp. NPDC004629 TaxID=3364705 RepID=UPI0036A4C1AE